MPLDNPPLGGSCFQQISMVRQEIGLSIRRPARLVRQHGRDARDNDIEVHAHIPPEAAVVVGWGYRDCRSLPVEAARGQCSSRRCRRASRYRAGSPRQAGGSPAGAPSIPANRPPFPLRHAGFRDTGFHPAATSSPQRPDTRWERAGQFNRTSVSEFVSLAFSVEKSRWGSRAGFLSLYACRSVRNTHDRCVSMTSTSMGFSG